MMTAETRLKHKRAEDLDRAVSAVQSYGACGTPSENGAWLCLLPFGHAGEHGTPVPEPPKYAVYMGRAYNRLNPDVDNDPKWPVLIDPADPDQIRNAGLCRVDEVETWLVADAGIGPYDLAEFRGRFGGKS